MAILGIYKSLLSYEYRPTRGRGQGRGRGGRGAQRVGEVSEYKDNYENENENKNENDNDRNGLEDWMTTGEENETIRNGQSGGTYVLQ